MYKNNFVVSLKANNKFLREVKSQIEVPFGTEYSIYLKNLNDTDAAVTLEIDGKSIFPEKIIVKAKDSVEVKGDAHNFAFKFIEKTQKISEFRGNKAEDGLLTVNYQFIEKTKQQDFSDELKKLREEIERLQRIRPYQWHRPYWWDWYYVPSLVTNGYSVTNAYSNYSVPTPKTYVHSQPYAAAQSMTFDGDGYRGGTIDSDTVTKPVRNCWTTFDSGEKSCGSGFDSSLGGLLMQNATQPKVENTSGITVPGSEISQCLPKIDQYVGTESHTIIVQLVGKIDDVPVVTPTYSREKVTCKTCGTSNESDHKFCKECGTNLKA